MSYEFAPYTRNFTQEKNGRLDEMLSRNFFESTFSEYKYYAPPEYQIIFKNIAENPNQPAAVGYHDVAAIDAQAEGHETLVIWPVSKQKTATDIFVLRKTYYDDLVTPLGIYILDAPEVYAPYDDNPKYSLPNYINTIITIYDKNHLWENDKPSFHDAAVYMNQVWRELKDPAWMHEFPDN